MSRVALTKTTAPGPYPTAGVELLLDLADSSLLNQFALTGQEIVIVHNKHATVAKTVTFTSTACSHGRTGNITAESIPAGATRMFGPFRNKAGWAQTDGTLHLQGESADIQFGVILMPQLV